MNIKELPELDQGALLSLLTSKLLRQYLIAEIACEKSSQRNITEILNVAVKWETENYNLFCLF